MISLIRKLAGSWLLLQHGRTYIIHQYVDRLPKIIFYSELHDGACSRGGQKKRYKEVVKSNLRKCDIQPRELEVLAADRSEWRCRCYESIQQFKVDRVYAAEDKRTRRNVVTRHTRHSDISVRHYVGWASPCTKDRSVVLITAVMTRYVVSTAQSIHRQHHQRQCSQVCREQQHPITHALHSPRL